MNSSSHRFLSVLCLVALGAIDSLCFAQQTATPASSGAAAGIANAQGAVRAKVVAYSADQVSVTTQTLADGTKITHKSFAKVYRDSQGRTRYESFAIKAESGEPDVAPFSISIFDQVAGVSYYLNPSDHTAQRHEVPKPTASHSPTAAGGSANLAPVRKTLPRPTREDLGTQVIEGLEAKGERVTRIIPEGMEGNDQPLQISTETWFSAEGHLVLLRISNDPRRGETVTRMSDVVFEEPPAELFQVPADYTVQELQPVGKPAPPSD